MAEADAGLIEHLNPEAVGPAMGLDRRHVDQQLAVHRLTTVCVENTSDSAHNARSDDIHDAFGPVHHLSLIHISEPTRPY